MSFGSKEAKMTKDSAGDRAERIRAAMEAVPLSEVVSRLGQEDPEYAERVKKTHNAAAPILAELEESGFKIEPLSQLRDLCRSWRPALPILLRWLSRIEDRDIEEEIVRGLSVPRIGSQATEQMIELFRRAPSDSSVAWATGNALSIVDVTGFEDQIVSLCLDSKYGTARQMLVMSLSRFKDDRAEDVALRLLDDEGVKMHAIIALGKMRSRQALPRLEFLLKDKKAPIRKEAREAIESIRSS